MVSLIALELLNTVDSGMTFIALRKGYRELNPSIRRLIEKYGLNRAILLKTLLGILFALILAIPTFMFDIPGLSLAATILCLAGVAAFSVVLLSNCMQLLRIRLAKRKQQT
jgi:hypothetical protein